MIKIIKYTVSFVFLMVLLAACKKMDAPPDVSQPLVQLKVDKDSVTIGNQAIPIGPVKGYEQGSDVVYQLIVTSSNPLSKLVVQSSSGKISALSKVLKTQPENAIDTNGNFIQQLNKVVIYYSYHIDTTVIPLSNVTLTFSLQNEKNYIGFSTHSFSVIKKGSTNGKPLIKIEMPWWVYNRDGIGTQDNLDVASGLIVTSGEQIRINRGPFYSFDNQTDIGVSTDAIKLADKIDLVGYKTKSTGTNPVLVNGSYYLVSPSDTVVLTSTYTGATSTPDAQNLKMRNTIRNMAAKLANDGKTLRKVYFKRLDNITGPNQVTAAYFDVLTHDNEFNTLLAGITTGGQTSIGPIGFDEVYGFVMDNGRRGLIRTISSTVIITTDVGGFVPGTVYSIPTPSSSGNLLCTIKYQDK
jgi:hypothetical protein